MFRRRPPRPTSSAEVVPLSRTQLLGLLAGLLLVGGVALRIVAWLAYQPALLYIDTFRYLGNLEELRPTDLNPLGYTLLLGAPTANTLLFWAVPSILSSLQLFAFGTYLPHRHEEEAFRDRHNARSNDYPRWLSLLTCFHFGYHHEHHAKPGTPWWRLPSIRGTT